MHSLAGFRLIAGVAILLLCLPLGSVGAADDAEVEAAVKSLLARMEKAGDAELWRLSRELGEKDVPVLKRLLPETEPRVRLAVARALVRLGERNLGIETLVALAGEGPPTAVRVSAVEILGETASDAQEEALLLLLDDAFDPRLRISLARTLWQLTYNLRAKEELKAVLKSSDPAIRTEGALALAEIGAIEDAKPVLTEISAEPTPQGRLARALLEQARWREMVLARGAPGRKPEPGEPAEEPEKPELSTVYSDRLLKQIQDYVREFYQDAPELTDVDLLEAAAKGIMDALDPHSVYFTPKERFDWQEDLNPIYGGIGSYVNFVGDYFTIVRPMFGGPAYKAGLKASDQIWKVDGWETTGKTTQEIVSKLRGEPGTRVIVTVYRRGWRKPRDFELERAKIEVPTVDSVLMPGGVGYARLTTFGGDTVADLETDLELMESQGLKALVLDGDRRGVPAALRAGRGRRSPHLWQGFRAERLPALHVPPGRAVEGREREREVRLQRALRGPEQERPPGRRGALRRSERERPVGQGRAVHGP
jgi:hypothetical protein